MCSGYVLFFLCVVENFVVVLVCVNVIFMVFVYVLVIVYCCDD